MTKPKRVESGVYELIVDGAKYRIVKTGDRLPSWEGGKWFVCWAIFRVEEAKLVNFGNDSLRLKDAVRYCARLNELCPPTKSGEQHVETRSTQ